MFCYNAGLGKPLQHILLAPPKPLLQISCVKMVSLYPFCQRPFSMVYEHKLWQFRNQVGVSLGPK